MKPAAARDLLEARIAAQDLRDVRTLLELRRVHAVLVGEPDPGERIPSELATVAVALRTVAVALRMVGSAASAVQHDTPSPAEAAQTAIPGIPPGPPMVTRHRYLPASKDAPYVETPCLHSCGVFRRIGPFGRRQGNVTQWKRKEDEHWSNREIRCVPKGKRA